MEKVKRRKKNLALILFILFLILSSFLVYKVKMDYLEKDEKKEKEEIGKIAPVFSLKDLDGKEVNLSEIKGKTIVLNFFATWCVPCVMELGQFQWIESSLTECNALLFLISNEDVNSLKKFVKENDYKFRVLVDEKGDVFSLYKVNAIPKTVIIDEDGKIIFSKIGTIKNGYELLPYLRSDKEKKSGGKASYDRSDNILKLVKCDCKCDKSLYECRCADCPQRKKLNEIRIYIRQLVIDGSFSDEQIAQIAVWKFCEKSNSRKEGAGIEGN